MNNNQNKKVLTAHTGVLILSIVLMCLISFIMKKPLLSREFIIAVTLGTLNTSAMIFLDIKTLQSNNAIFWGLLMKGAKTGTLLILLALTILKGEVNDVLFTTLFFTNFLLSMITETVLFGKIKLNTNKEQKC